MATQVQIGKTVYQITSIEENYIENLTTTYTTYKLQYKNTFKTMVGGVFGFTLYDNKYGRRALGKKVEPQFIQ